MTFKEMDDVRFQKYGSFSSDPHATRVRRAISWGMAAETATGEDEQFIFYWITLNATYGNEEMAAANERLKRATFFALALEITEHRAPVQQATVVAIADNAHQGLECGDLRLRVQPAPEIPGVPDHIDILQKLLELRRERAVTVRNKSDEHAAIRKQDTPPWPPGPRRFRCGDGRSRGGRGCSRGR